MQLWLVLQLLETKGEKYPLSVGLHPIGLCACTCPASRWKKEPIISNRDIKGLMDGELIWSGDASGANTPCIVPQMVGGTQQSLLPGEGTWKEDCPVIGELMSDGLICDQGNLQRGMPLTVPLIRVITSWSLGQVCRMVSHMNRCGREGHLSGGYQRAREQPSSVA